MPLHLEFLDFSLLRTNYYKQGPVAVTAAASAADSPAPTGAADLHISPPASAVRVGDTFAVALMVSAGSQPVDGADVAVGFDPQYLRVVDTNGQETNRIRPGPRLSMVLRNEVDNKTGRIGYSAGQLEGSVPAGQFELATVRFRLIAKPPAASQVSYLAGTDLSFQGASVLRQTEGGTVVPSSGGVYLPLLER